MGIMTVGGGAKGKGKSKGKAKGKKKGGKAKPKRSMAATSTKKAGGKGGETKRRRRRHRRAIAIVKPGSSFWTKAHGGISVASAALALAAGAVSTIALYGTRALTGAGWWRTIGLSLAALGMIVMGLSSKSTVGQGIGFASTVLGTFIGLGTLAQQHLPAAAESDA